MEDVGLRERKKLRTRRALVAAAIQLFKTNGYAETTVAEIAAEADVATKTFFNYFRGKDDVLFADSQERLELAIDTINERGTDDTAAAVLARIGERITELLMSHGSYLSPEHALARTHLVMTVPALQARALLLIFDAQKQFAQALRKAFPDDLDELTAAAMVGAWMGATQAAALASLERGDPPEKIWLVARQAAQQAAMRLGDVPHPDRG